MEQPAAVLDISDESISYESLQIDPLVISKIIEHANDEGEETANGSLVGLCNGKALEITNCFALPNAYAPRHQSQSALPAVTVNDPELYQSEMIRFLREAGCDYLQLGFYQTIPPTANPVRGINLIAEGINLAVSLQDYHKRTGFNVALIYDPIKSRNGTLSLKAYRLSEQALSIESSLADLTPETASSLGITYKTLLEEVPVLFKRSALTSVLLMDIAEQHPSEELVLGLESPTILENTLNDLTTRLENVIAESYSLSTFSRQLQRYNQQKHNLILERKRENEQRKAKGEALLPEDVSSNLPPLPTVSRLQSLVACHELNQSNQYLSNYVKEALFKVQKLELNLKK